MAIFSNSIEEEVDSENAQLDFYPNSSDSNLSAVSWSAIFAGAVAAAVLSLILLLLGTGLGLSSVSPWANKGVSAGSFGISTIIWIAVTQILAAGMGGYLAGRLRTRWADVHADEVYFRDTAHGFLSWGVATLATVTLLTSAIGGIVNGAGNLVSGVATSTAAAVTVANHGNESNNSINTASDELGYFVDSLFRNNSVDNSAASVNSSLSENTIPTSQVTRIFVNSKDDKTLPAADVTYVGQLIAKNSGLTQQEAEKRVTDVFTTIQLKKADAKLAAKDAAEKARKATIYATLWLFVSLLIGAFSASLAATWGGRCRDGDFINQPNTY